MINSKKDNQLGKVFYSLIPSTLEPQSPSKMYFLNSTEIMDKICIGSCNHESWLVVAVDMGEKFKVNNVACPTVVLPIAVSAAKLAEGESLFGKPKNGKLEILDEGLFISMDTKRNLRFEK